MTQCAKIIVQLLAHFGNVFYQTFVKVFLSPTFYVVNHMLARECECVVKATKQVDGKGQNSTSRHAETT